jgi:hypothetical protein
LNSGSCQKPVNTGAPIVFVQVKQALKQLLDALDEISKTHAEVSDTAAREVMAVAVHRGFVLGVKGYKLPAKFAMFSEAGKQLVREACIRRDAGGSGVPGADISPSALCPLR